MHFNTSVPVLVYVAIKFSNDDMTMKRSHYRVTFHNLLDLSRGIVAIWVLFWRGKCDKNMMETHLAHRLT